VSHPKIDLLLEILDDMWVTDNWIDLLMSLKQNFLVLKSSFMALGMATLLFSLNTGAAQLAVQTFEDELNDNGRCSLREAIVNANRDDQSGSIDCPAGQGEDTIFLPAGTYTLSLSGRNEDEALSGDLDLNSQLTLIGEGAQRTVISARGIDRVLHIGQAGGVRIEGITLAGGATDEAASDGGGVFVSAGARVDIVDSAIVENFSNRGRGGGIYTLGELALTNTTVRDNSTDPENGNGNSAPGSSGGGGVVRQTKEGEGGGLYNGPGANLFVFNCTVSANTSKGRGGGVFNDANGVANVNHCTVADNVSQRGFGDAFHNSFGGILLFKNTVIANPALGNDCSGNVAATGNNLASDDSCGLAVTFSRVDPMLAPLALNGGTTQTHALSPESPAVNASNDCTLMDGFTRVETDQRGVARPQGDRCDLGAFELEM